ncbi:type IV secretion protein Rhs [Buttiauxella selenatireducens]|uniref:Type IV secretion protein Rhs n=1 Tax=Buttiauxella selenatireducens TaxID=3073902 RepID=A0ABY9SG62_9ENTR|nr:type IV secretion protein Rhs [Buttiauxella sp. R73]WMY76503.1 type IV secretion protein Rhs [Buttiauxella sp. R73]
MLNNIQPGGLRLLTPGEIALANSLYGFSIYYNRVWIHREGYLPMNLQPDDIGMTPDGEMWFRGKYEDDFSMPRRWDSVEQRHLFLHEMMHVWQNQHGMWVRTRGLFSRFVDYSYSLDKDNLSDYGMEQQASIVSDYWLLKTYGFSNYAHLIESRDYKPDEPYSDLLQKYEKVLRNFPR